MGTNADKVVMWVNGRVVSSDEPAIPADDHGLVGDGAFEAIKVLDGRPFALSRHLRRLQHSLDPLGIELDVDAARAATTALMATRHAQVSPSWLRITVTGGSAPMGTGGIGNHPTMVAAVAPMAPWAPTADVVVCPWVRNERGATAGLKTISYAENVIAYRYAHANKADESIFANTKDQLCEGTGSNVMLESEGRLVTPTLAAGILGGITRELLLEWLPDDLEERDVPIEHLAQTSEAILTSTSRDVHPIASVNGGRLPAAPGPLTRHAMEVWATNSGRDIDP